MSLPARQIKATENAGSTPICRCFSLVDKTFD